MVLIVEKCIVSALSANLDEFLNSYPILYNRAKNFTSEPLKVVDPHFSLYVGQGEYAIVPAADDTIRVIGSDSATTCHVIILHHSSGSVAVTHFDGKKYEYKALENMVSELVPAGGNIKELDAYVVGGYLENGGDLKQKESEAISMKILQMFMDVFCSVNLLLWCTVSSNTKIIDGKPSPIINGLAIDRRNYTVFPAVFPSQLPNYNLRSASYWVTSHEDVVSIYNFRNKTVSIQPFFNWDQHSFKCYSRLPDHVLLKCFSTSPLVEPPTFCERLRKSFELLGSSSTETLFPGHHPRMYKMNSVGEWNEV